VNGTQYGCSLHNSGGSAACANARRVNRRLAEVRLLAAVTRLLFDPADVQRFRSELRRRLETSDPAEERRDLLRQLDQVKTEVQNLIRAIKAGVAVEDIRAELRNCERQRSKLEHRLASLQCSGSSPPTDGLDEYALVLEELQRLAETNITAARERIKALIGEIRLVEHKGEIVAIMTGDMLGLLSLTAPRSDLLLFRENADGVRGAFGKFQDGRLFGVVTARSDLDPSDPDDGGGGSSGGAPHGGMLELAKSSPRNQHLFTRLTTNAARSTTGRRLAVRTPLDAPRFSLRGEDRGGLWPCRGPAGAWPRSFMPASPRRPVATRAARWCRYRPG